ncbi:MAG: hypothetical protein U0521_15350 [Anaerolineae bacterium]
MRAIPGAFARASLTFSPYALINTVERTQHVFFSDAMPRADVERHFARIQEDLFRAYLDFLLFAGDTRRIRERGTKMLIVGAGADDWIFPSAEMVALGGVYEADVTISPKMAHDDARCRPGGRR